MSAPLDDTLLESGILDAEPEPEPEANAGSGEPDDPNLDSDSDHDFQPGPEEAEEPEDAEEPEEPQQPDEPEDEGVAAGAEATGAETADREDSDSDGAENETAATGGGVAAVGPSSSQGRLPTRGGLAGRGRGRGRGGSSGGRGSRPGSKKTSRATKAGLQFSVSKVERQLRQKKDIERLGAGAPVYLAAVLEYLIAEMVELGGNCARDNKRKRITPRDIKLAVKNDEELDRLCGDAVVPGGGVLHQIHSVLLPKKKPNKKVSQEV